jgi:hypothetical protein
MSSMSSTRLPLASEKKASLGPLVPFRPLLTHPHLFQVIGTVIPFSRLFVFSFSFHCVPASLYFYTKTLRTLRTASLQAHMNYGLQISDYGQGISINHP